MIRVCLVEDQPKTRESLVKLLRLSDTVVCLGAFGGAEEAEREIPGLQPDVVLMDINLGGGRSGVECVAKLKIANPQIQIMMLTTYDDNNLIFNSLSAGASGYLLKRATPGELLDAISDLHAGGSPMSFQIARKVVSHFHQHSGPQSNLEELTKREKEILGLLASGLPYKIIADKLDISGNTVRNILQHIYKKLHVQSRVEATMKFLQG